MWCVKCNEHVSKCTCPDIEERLNKLAHHPNLAIEYCNRCKKHHDLCTCDDPESIIRTGERVPEGEMVGMDIDSPPGTRVVFYRPKAGYDHDIEMAVTYLILGETYTVEKTIIHSWNTDVFLIEIPGVHFNSVQFGVK